MKRSFKYFREKAHKNTIRIILLNINNAISGDLIANNDLFSKTFRWRDGN